MGGQKLNLARSLSRGEKGWPDYEQKQPQRRNPYSIVLRNPQFVLTKIQRTGGEGDKPIKEDGTRSRQAAELKPVFNSSGELEEADKTNRRSLPRLHETELE